VSDFSWLNAFFCIPNTEMFGCKVMLTKYCVGDAFTSSLVVALLVILSG
jgi:hypothetical protein